MIFKLLNQSLWWFRIELPVIYRSIAIANDTAKNPIIPTEF